MKEANLLNQITAQWQGKSWSLSEIKGTDKHDCLCLTSILTGQKQGLDTLLRWPCSAQIQTHPFKIWHPIKGHQYGTHWDTPGLQPLRIQPSHQGNICSKCPKAPCPKPRPTRPLALSSGHWLQGTPKSLWPVPTIFQPAWQNTSCTEHPGPVSWSASSQPIKATRTQSLPRGHSYTRLRERAISHN